MPVAFTTFSVDRRGVAATTTVATNTMNVGLGLVAVATTLADALWWPLLRGDTARRAMQYFPGDGVAAATNNRSFTTSTDTKPTPTPFPHSHATGVRQDRYPGCVHGGAALLQSVNVSSSCR
uniref:Uncharacterized protein n=1 Tax=Oryza sativa subsp. japonica TaxID=39947 RepID=Q6Z7M2_ORYSJ|nr:hypothetical protein [Oryza sativa Japonica Group]